MNQQRTQIKGHQDENQQSKEQIVQLKTQINTCQRENQKLNASLTKEDSRIISINTQLRE
jgi:phage host-nuclease inhibitor protein Gam